ncbi:MAG: DNA recombination protein RmuC [Patescibacteria group bacterium]
MMEIFVIALTIVVGIGFFLLYQRLASLGKKDDTTALTLLNEQFSERMREISRQFEAQAKQVSLQLANNADILQKSNKNIGERLDSAAKVVGGVTEKLGKLEEANKRIYDVGKDIASLQDILRAPKLRGSLGEFFLGDLLSQYFPKSQFSMPYTFRNGKKVDAALHLADKKIVPIDSKFPLESFNKMITTKDEKEKKLAQKAFINAVKKQIDEITQYILPDEGTMEFALMYIPAENVYYEVIIKDEGEDTLSSYAFKKRVIPVSPNNFFVYLQTIVMGLKGLQVEENAMSMLQAIVRLKDEFGRFGEAFEVLGSHITHTSQKYDDSRHRFEKIGQKIENIELVGERADEKLLK